MAKQANKAPATPAKAEDKKASTPADLLAKHGFKYGNKQWTPEDVANEAIAIQQHTDELEVARQNFGPHFIAMAQTCSTINQFLMVCGAVEARNSWKSKQNPDGKDKAPGVWNQTKSNVKVAWETFGMKPGKDYKTSKELNDKLNEARNNKKAAEGAAEGAKKADNAIQEAAKQDTNFGNLMARMVTLYGEQTGDGKARLLEALGEVYNTFSDSDKDVKELMADLEKEGTGAYQAAKSH